MIYSPKQVLLEELEVDVCIIGSGAGGAIAAAKLAELGLHVVVLEDGPAAKEQDFNQLEFAWLA